MSVVFVAYPIVAALPVLVTAAVAVASTSGFTLVEQTSRELHNLLQTSENVEEIEMEAKEELAQVLEAEGGFTLQKDDLTLTFYRSKKDGRVRMCVNGAKNRSKNELKAIGRDMMDKIMQRYAYDRLMNELKKEGYKVVTEATGEDRSIRIKVRKW